MTDGPGSVEVPAAPRSVAEVEGTDQFDVFLSYRRSDGSRFAHKFRRLLLTAHQRLPEQAAPLRIYLDRIQARADLDFYTETIRPALLGSRWLIVVATPDAARRPEGKTDWIAREIEEFIAHRGIDRIRVVHARGKTLPDLPHDLLARMTAAQEIDLRGLFRLLPGTRAQEDWESLMATLFALGPAQMPLLRREEERLQRNRVSRLAGGVTGAAVFATALSGYALYQAAESRQDVERAAAVLAANFDPNQIGACDALDALWANGATLKAFPAMRCRIARANRQWFKGHHDLARQTMGSWEDFTATLPDLGPDLAEELADARHLFEISAIDYDHFDATGHWFGVDAPLPAEGRDTALRAIAEVERALGEVDSLEGARETLSQVLWPLLTLLEDAGETEASVALMTRAAQALEPHAEFSIETVASPDDPWLLDYGLLARRIAYYSNQAGAADAALDWSARALRAFGAFDQIDPWALYQHGLAWLVRGQVEEATGAAVGDAFAKARLYVRRAVDEADPAWRALTEARETLAHLDVKGTE